MKLKEYLDVNGLKMYAFADRLNIPYKTLWTLLKKGDMKLSLAIKIEEATQGQVTCRELLQEHLQEKIPSQEKPRKKNT